MPIHIHEIAKKLGLEEKEVLTHAKALGIAAAKVPSSSLDKITAQFLEQQIVDTNPELQARLLGAKPVAAVIAPLPARKSPPPSTPGPQIVSTSLPASGSEENGETIHGVARTNYIFVDYENVQELDLHLIAGKPVKVFLIVGPRQKSLPYALTKQIHKYHDQVQLIESERASRNALDLVLAYHVGFQARTDPEGYYHVLAKDKDYEALIKHLRAQEIRACRDEEFARVSALVDVSRLTLEERVQWVAARIAKNKASRPGRKNTLLANIHGHCRKRLSETEVQQILDRMIAQKLIAVGPQGVVEYRI